MITVAARRKPSLYDALFVVSILLQYILVVNSQRKLTGSLKMSSFDFISTNTFGRSIYDTNEVDNNNKKKEVKKI